MKRTLFFSFLLCIGFTNTNAQDNDDYTNTQNARKLKTRTLLVSIQGDENSESNQKLIKAFDKFWKFCKHEFIAAGDEEKYMNDTSYALFTDVSYVVRSTSGNNTYTYTYFGKGVLLCRKKLKIKNLKQSDILEFFNTNSYGNTVTVPQNFMVQIMQSSIIRKYKGESLEEKKDPVTNTKYFGNGLEEVKGKSLMMGFNDFLTKEQKVELSKNLGIDTTKMSFPKYEDWEKVVEEQNSEYVICFGAGAIVYSIDGRPLCYLDYQTDEDKKRTRNFIGKIAIVATAAVVVFTVGVIFIFNRVIGA